MLVIDAAVVVTACLSEAGLDPLAKEQLVAPYLMWSEASSVLHELRWRKEISSELAATAVRRLSQADISPRRPKGLTDEAWRIADRLGWAKTWKRFVPSIQSWWKRSPRCWAECSEMCSNRSLKAGLLW